MTAQDFTFSMVDDDRLDEHVTAPLPFSSSLYLAGLDPYEPDTDPGTIFDDDDRLTLRWVTGWAGPESAALSWHLTFDDFRRDSMETECNRAIVEPFVSETSAGIRPHALICTSCRKAAARYLDRETKRELARAPQWLHWVGSDLS